MFEHAKFNMREAPKIMGLEIGRTKFMAMLREQGFLDQFNYPNQQYLINGYFTLCENIKAKGRLFLKTPLLTWTGIVHLMQTVDIDDLNQRKIILVDESGNSLSKRHPWWEQFITNNQSEEYADL